MKINSGILIHMAYIGKYRHIFMQYLCTVPSRESTHPAEKARDNVAMINEPHRREYVVTSLN